MCVVCVCVFGIVQFQKFPDFVLCLNQIEKIVISTAVPRTLILMLVHTILHNVWCFTMPPRLGCVFIDTPDFLFNARVAN